MVSFNLRANVPEEEKSQNKLQDLNKAATARGLYCTDKAKKQNKTKFATFF